MSTDLPPASISGQHGWKWNELQAQNDPHDSPSSPGDRPDEHAQSARQGDHRTPNRSRHASDSRRGSETPARPTDASRCELAAALERKERRLQYVIDHYEHKLEQKNRKLARRREAGWSDRLQSLLSSLFEYLSR